MTPEAKHHLDRAREYQTHSGMRSAFARLVKGDPRFDRTLARFLGQAYKLKEITDYGTGPQAVVSTSTAREMIDTAERLFPASRRF